MPNISRSKGNQTMKLGQLKEYNMSNIFIEKSYSKYDGVTKKTNKIEHISEFVFIVCPSRGLSKYIETKVLTICFYLVETFFKKQKEVRN